MLSKMSFAALMLSLFAVFAFAADSGIGSHHDTPVGSAWSRRHTRAAPAPLQRRQGTSSRFTYYDAGMGACGRVNTNADFIVAMNSGQFAGGAHCFETITITVNGKTAQATVTDECPGCPLGGLDFSRGLFEFFASESAGVLTGDWIFGAPVASKPAPTPTPTPTPTPSSTVAPSTSSTPPSPSSSVLPSSVVPSSSAAPVPSSLVSGGQDAPGLQGNLAMAQVVFIEIGATSLSAVSL
ncbi:RlpA-like double-psi beta-barrel-protein domain-containing protein-containing protein [Crepidotus variabilis]|uniref:RlpA-like double-psi beta-barrel-protein domain-containing protein-containing protein n=1 Tax=Crepidotus variabilis TaxID=179855 RepID=A0A9P6EQP6_9AGAR|nr:RlpA-like double-psi beta-barrel-protein domain-containing protein-containing protein [Crepidotus variabilis]